MSINSLIIGVDKDARTNQAGVDNDKRLRVSVRDVASRNGTFKAVNRTTAGTTIITSPDLDAGIVLTDLIVTTDKTANSDVIIQFTDDAQTIVIAKFDSVNQSINFSISFAGHWQGWQNARLEVITTGTVDATVSIGYFKQPTGDTDVFAVWDAKR